MRHLDLIHSQLAATGYSTVDLNCLEEALTLATHFGEITADARNPELYRQIRPQPFEIANPNTLSSRYGMGRFPFHTDAAHWKVPPEYIFLFCEAPGSGSRPTAVIDTYGWSIDASTLQGLTSAVWKVGHQRPRLCTVGFDLHGQWNIRYDEACMQPMSAQARALQVKLQEVIETASPKIIEWVYGRLLIMNNRRVLHARGTTSKNDPDRVLVRILVGGVQ